MEEDKKIQILLADDHQILREGLRVMLEQQSDMEVVAEVDNGNDAVKKSFEFEPDVIVMDIAMPDMNGIAATEQIKTRKPEVQVLCLSVHSETQLATSMLKAGATGYLVKTSPMEEFLKAIRIVASGQTYLCPQIAQELVTSFSQGKDDGAKNMGGLSKREIEVLQLVAQGHHTDEIAGRLTISSKTVLAHRQNIMDKLGLDSTVALARYALRKGLVEL